MIDRYPAPLAEAIFSDSTKFSRWRQITNLYAVASMEELGDAHLIEVLKDFDETPTVEAVRTREQIVGHDVVAFLSVYTQDMPDEIKRHIHRGLTSSDLVEYGHHLALFSHANLMRMKVVDLQQTLKRWEMQDTVRVGRTHGQMASPTALNHQLWVYHEVLDRIRVALLAFDPQTPLIKTPGPTGMTPWAQQRGNRVVAIENGERVRATQMIPRDHQIEWASVYLRLAGVLENLALLVRLGSRSEVGEVREKATANRVGSSAMAHKKNPIDSEKVCGLARVCRGYFATIAENNAFWEDRDLTNSSVERIVVPDLAATVEHMLDVMTKVMVNLEFTPTRQNLVYAAPWTALAQALLQEVAVIGPIEASEVVRNCFGSDQHHVNTMSQRIWTWLDDNKSQEVADRWVQRFDKWVDEFTA